MDPLLEHDPAMVGDFELVGRLGSGGMGQVYVGTAPAGRKVAIKVVHESLAGDKQFRKRFGREVAAARLVKGTRTAEVLAADPEALRPWMATAYVDGPNLLDAVEDNGPLPADSVLELAAHIAEALAVIHRAGLVHRDLKPSNVVLGSDGPRVIDFGIARATEASTLTSTGQVSGSAGFMSPEQALGRPIEAPSDVFSLGAVLYYAATGQCAFGIGNTPALLFRVVHSEPDLTALIHPTLSSIIAACLAKDPADRPAPLDIVAMARGQRPVPQISQDLSPGGSSGKVGGPEAATFIRIPKLRSPLAPSSTPAFRPGRVGTRIAAVAGVLVLLAAAAVAAQRGLWTTAANPPRDATTAITPAGATSTIQPPSVPGTSLGKSQSHAFAPFRSHPTAPAQRPTAQAQRPTAAARPQPTAAARA
jgi:serine/threonine protein kinase